LRTLEEIELIRGELEGRLRAIGRRVHLIANYDGFELDPTIADAYFTLVAYIQDHYYQSASRYTTSAFMRLKFQSALAERDLAPHVFETREEAQIMLDGSEARHPA
jgi:propionate CoA-transferase